MHRNRQTWRISPVFCGRQHGASREHVESGTTIAADRIATDATLGSCQRFRQTTLQWPADSAPCTADPHPVQAVWRARPEKPIVHAGAKVTRPA